MPRSLLDLPQELLFLILEDTDGHRPSLKACALTCKALVLPARRCLHREVTIKAENVHALSQTYTSRELARWVRVLNLDSERMISSDESSSWMAQPSEHRSLLNLLNIFVSSPVNEIMLRIIRWKFLSREVVDALMQFKRVVELTLIDVHIPDPAELHNFILSFPLLSNLYVDHVVQDGLTTLTYGAAPAELPNLTKVNFAQSDEFILQLLAEPKLPALYDLAIIWEDTSEVYCPGFIGAILCHAPSLRNLVITANVSSKIGQSHLDELRSALSLAHNRKLKYLGFKNIQIQYDELTWPLNMLETVSSGLEVIYLEFHTQPGQLATFDWTRLSGILSGPPFKQTFVHVKVKVHRPPDTASGIEKEAYLECEYLVKDVLTDYLHRLLPRMTISVQQYRTEESEGEESNSSDDDSEICDEGNSESSDTDDDEVDWSYIDEGGEFRMFTYESE